MTALRSSFELGVNSVVTNYRGRAVEIRVRVGSWRTGTKLIQVRVRMRLSNKEKARTRAFGLASG